MQKEVANYLLKELKDYGIYLHYVSNNKSYYLRFRKKNLGIIRISNHSSNDNLVSKYDIYTDNKDIVEQILNIVSIIKGRKLWFF